MFKNICTNLIFNKAFLKLSLSLSLSLSHTHTHMYISLHTSRAHNIMLVVDE